MFLIARPIIASVVASVVASVITSVVASVITSVIISVINIGFLTLEYSVANPRYVARW